MTHTTTKSKGVGNYLSHAVAKPVVAGVTAAVADHFFMKNTNINSNVYFGAAVGAGIFSVSWVEPIVGPLFPTHTPIGAMSKGLEGRVVEIALGSASAYAMNKFILKNEYTNQDMVYKLGIVVFADLIGETVCEFLCIV
jgi:hypothetical protein